MTSKLYRELRSEGKTLAELVDIINDPPEKIQSLLPDFSFSPSEMEQAQTQYIANRWKVVTQ